MRSALECELAGLRRLWPRIRWVAPANLHLTLAFLGHIYPEQVQAAGTVLAEVAAGSRPFNLAFATLGVFGPPRAPRVVWVGTGEGTDCLLALQARLAAGLRQVGLVPEDRPFSPHLTLGRVRAAQEAAGLGEWLRQHAARSYGTASVAALHLMQSDLCPQGPVYTPLRSAGLAD